MVRPDPSPARDDDLESTASILEKVRAGDASARNRLCARYLATFRRWAHGRLPNYARSLVDTDDLVQVTLLRALDNVHEFEPRREGAFLAYLRRILLNQIRDEIRTVQRFPRGASHSSSLPDNRNSPLENLINKETTQRYETALMTLSPLQREALVMRIELGFKHKQIAEAVGSPTGNAARMLVARAIVQMAKVMRDERE